MADYILTNKAIEDLSTIWDYSFEVWSESQADKYYQELISHCQKIAKNPEIAKNYNGISNQLFGMKVNQHIIFYRVQNESFVEITRILHERMDLKKRIAE